jgi:hypothetical protein
MNVIEGILLFTLCIVTFWLFGLIGLFVLGLIVAILYTVFKPKKEVEVEQDTGQTTLTGFNLKPSEKPCYAHGLSYCPYCLKEENKNG